MLTYALAADPRTPTETLVWLAAQGPHAPGVALALAVHPNFPPAVRLPLGAPKLDEVRDALNHPEVCSARRAEFIAAAGRVDVIALIHDSDTLTSEEIAAFVSTPHTDSPVYQAKLARALTLNPKTPAGLARAAARSLVAAYESQPWNGPLTTPARNASAISPIVAALRHRIPVPAEPGTAPYSGPRALDTFVAELAQHMVDARAYPQHSWWGVLIEATCDPAVARHALEAPASGGIMEHVQAVTYTRRLPQEVRDQALSHPDYMVDARDVPAGAMSAQVATRFVETGDTGVMLALLTRPTTSASTIAQIHHTTTQGRRRALHQKIASYVLLHPNTPDDVRTATARSLCERTSDVAMSDPRVMLAAYISANHDGPDSPGAYLDAPASLLVSARAWRDDLFHRTRLTAAYLEHGGPPVDQGSAQALLALAPTFTGTLRELLSTARTVAA